MLHILHSEDVSKEIFMTANGHRLAQQSHEAIFLAAENVVNISSKASLVLYTNAAPIVTCELPL